MSKCVLWLCMYANKDLFAYGDYGVQQDFCLDLSGSTERKPNEMHVTHSPNIPRAHRGVYSHIRKDTKETSFSFVKWWGKNYIILLKRMIPEIPWGIPNRVSLLWTLQHAGISYIGENQSRIPSFSDSFFPSFLCHIKPQTCPFRCCVKKVM